MRHLDRRLALLTGGMHAAANGRGETAIRFAGVFSSGMYTITTIPQRISNESPPRTKEGKLLNAIQLS